MRRYLDNTIEGNYKGRKLRNGKRIIMRPGKFWIPMIRVGMSRDWYKPRSASTKRGQKRGQSKPR